jgi:hypothetical protein
MWYNNTGKKSEYAWVEYGLYMNGDKDENEFVNS